ncbi:hypothetical protein F8M41_017416 [Gigaspora margarita]|uniref:Uncharacterized protein n=1 Tax=Gigaspora margarita TaxID=4874 RepID=A0A8H4B5A8_GIGMA|nr:hypothetical protein F8M41_017416 [Gigaspora margarita]
MIMCKFCGGRGYKKELHNYDNMEEKENESEWVGSSSSESDVKMDTNERGEGSKLNKHKIVCQEHTGNVCQVYSAAENL